jgi:hypothetical protein
MLSRKSILSSDDIPHRIHAANLNVRKRSSLMETVQSAKAPVKPQSGTRGMVFVIDDDPDLCTAMVSCLKSMAGK